jgi:hypothetical protein
MNQNLSQNQTRTVKISSLNSKSVYNENSNTWKTWVDLELIADDKAFPQGEFSTTISLPPGTWISDYYLYVGDRKEPGILVEKKSATWIYNQIRNERRDPGILYYTSANRTAFKVFPFGPKEIRKTGIEFIHREPVNIQIGNRSVHLGDPEIISSQVSFQSENAFYLSAKEKSALSKTQRKPVYYVIIDTSVGKEIHQDKFSKIIDIMIRKNNISESNLIFNFTNTFVMSENFSSDWKVKYKKQKFEGGFFLERAIKKSLFDAYTKNKNKYPVIIVLSDSLENAILEKDFSNFGFVYPESDIFYFIDPKGRLSSVQYSSPKKILQKENKLNINYEVLVWPNPEKPEAYLADDGLPGIIFKDQFPNINKPDLKEKDWFSAISISALENHILLHPEKSDSEWLNLVRYSFISRVMNSFTSYIVVETEAQKEILKRKQEQVLNSNKSLDLEEDSTRRMSEPGIWIFLFILGGGYIYRMIRSKRI